MSRSLVLSCFCWLGALAARRTPVGERPLPPISPRASQYVFDVTDYGAKGDNQTDNTAAFTKALSAAQNVRGAEVFVPSGFYVFQGSLTIPPGVTLRGTFQVGQMEKDKKEPIPTGRSFARHPRRPRNLGRIYPDSSPRKRSPLRLELHGRFYHSYCERSPCWIYYFLQRSRAC